jgi:hypothetical protein
MAARRRTVGIGRPGWNAHLISFSLFRISRASVSSSTRSFFPTLLVETLAMRGEQPLWHGLSCKEMRPNAAFRPHPCLCRLITICCTLAMCQVDQKAACTCTFASVRSADSDKSDCTTGCGQQRCLHLKAPVRQLKSSSLRACL